MNYRKYREELLKLVELNPGITVSDAAFALKGL